MPHTLKDVLPVTARVNEAGHLEIGGCDAPELAARFGTPLYVFDDETFATRARALRAAFPDATLYFAAKSFPSLAVLQLAGREGLGADVASAGELHAALAAGLDPAHLILHGNNKSGAEIVRAVEAGIGRIALDNLDDVERVAAAAAAAGRRQPVLLRVTPGVEAHTHTYIQTGQEDSKFGLSIEAGLAMAAVEAAVGQPALDLVGIHAHIGSNIFSYDPFGKTVEILFAFLAAAEARCGVRLSEVNLGGGLGIPYVAGDYPLRLDLLAALVAETAEREAARHRIPVPHLCFEPGRFLTGNACVTLYRVGVVKEIPGIRTYVSVDGGMSDNIRPALYQARYAAVVANKARHEPTRLVTVAGMHCESGDILVPDVPLPASVGRGDVLAIPATGAYGYSMASNYNKAPRPAVVLVRNGEAHEIVRRETLDDLLRLESPLP
ncbi:MAG TPA: diaminopimelate decarboxylase [Actinomycetota bacterium]|nr:diaminopimelate decarboxylase [Actinomycetota bacterium]